MLTVIIPTYNRSDLWKRGLLVASLCEQTDQNFEVIVIDDASTDSTLEVLQDIKRDASFPLRILSLNPYERTKGQASAIADNIGFREVKTPWLIHLDDDGYVDKNLIAYCNARIAAAKEPFVLYGINEFVDPQTLETFDYDERMRLFNSPDEDAFLLQQGCMQWGALWLAPTNVIRELGGHGMTLAGWKGQDSRLGVRIARNTPCWLSPHRAMRFYHLGRSTFAEARHIHRTTGNANELENVLKESALPQMIPLEDAVQNGGIEFWKGGNFPVSYCEA